MQEEVQTVVLPVFAVDGVIFEPAERKDMDVRMLGTGRPFVFEVHNARRLMPARCADLKGV
jgi:tRNA pseudouridine synthase 10